jgi:S-adenosylmethionine/arginine decarboxylase-like enzyme
VVKPLPRLRLQGFNNLTKALSFNIYDVCYAAPKRSVSVTLNTSTKSTTPTG